MATPKKKHSKQRTRVRHRAYEMKQQKRISNLVNIVTCSSCSARIPERTACPECGMYNGIQILETKKKSANVTVVSAD